MCFFVRISVTLIKVHIRSKQTVTWIKILCMSDESTISKWSCSPLEKHFSEDFCPACDNLPNADMDNGHIKMRTKKKIKDTFLWRRKTYLNGK